MIHRLRGLLMALVLVAVPAALTAQVPVTLGLSAGPSLPQAELGHEAGTGFHIQGSVGYAPAALPVGLRADLLFQRFPDDHDGSFTEIGGLANAVVGIPAGQMGVYLIGGVGAMHHDPPDEDHGDHVHAEEGEVTFAYALGGGLDLPIAALRTFLEARYLGAGDHGAVLLSLGIRF